MTLHKQIRKNLAIGIIALFAISAFAHILNSHNDLTINRKTATTFYKCNTPTINNENNSSKLYSYDGTTDRNYLNKNESALFSTIENKSRKQKFYAKSDDSPDSLWPMYSHDVRNTGRSIYNTAFNFGSEKWRYPTDGLAEGSPVIGQDGTIYIGSTALYAISPNGTFKWRYNTTFYISSAPAIDKNGIIYFGATFGARGMYALYPNGTLKWRYKTGNSVYSSPSIGEDGTIYFGSDDSDYPNYSGFIYALYPNGTLKWRYKTNHFVHSSPAIDEGGVIYCGSHDGYLYALFPNGTLKWKFKTGDWVARGPSIAEDGTIYFGSWDGYLYAVYPNSTLKWKSKVYPGTTPIIGPDGTIYTGSSKLRAIYPENGTLKWSYNPGQYEDIRGGNPCISADGIIYFGTHIGNGEGGNLIAVNPDGTERWRNMLATDYIDSAPAIGEDGTVYVGSSNDLYHPGAEGYLHAIGELDQNAPDAPIINGPVEVLPNVNYKYSFVSISPIGNDVYYYVDWGDNTVDGWLGPYSSGKEITISHKWYGKETTVIKARARDNENLWGPWGNLKITVTMTHQKINDIIINNLYNTKSSQYYKNQC